MPAPRATDAANTGWRLAMLGAAWPAGAAIQLREATLQAMPVYVGCMVLGLLLVAAATLAGRRSMVAALGLMVLAFGVTGGRASIRLAETLPITLEARDLQVTGWISSLPQRSSNGLRFRFEVEQATLDGQPITVPGVVSLGWYAGFQDGAGLTAGQLRLRAGQLWQFTVRLRRPHGLSNPHGFDQELRWFEDGVRATGSVRDAPAPRLLDGAVAHPIERLRQHVRDAVEASVVDRRAAGVLAALAVGDQSSIERDDWDLFRRTGISHLVSISGLHVTMFAWLSAAAIGAMWRRSERAMLWLAAPSAGLWGGFAVAALYAVFSGWGVPSQRTVWMLGTACLLRSAGLRWPWPLVLLAAATAVAVIDPWALLQPGFWLSFAAVGLLMLSGRAQFEAPGAVPAASADPLATAGTRGRALGPAIRGWVLGGVRTQWIATVALTPLTLVCFQQMSLIGFVANLLAIPLITLVVTPLALLGCIAAPLWTVGAWFVSLLCELLGWMAQAPASVWSVAVAPWWAQAAGLFAAAWMVTPLPWRVRALAVPLLLPLLLPARDLPAVGQFELVAADVGQGTAVIVRTRHHVLLYDAGPQYSPEFDAGQRVLLPLLRARGDHRIDMLVLSHRDTDHVGGAATLLQGLPIEELSSSIEDLHPLRIDARARGLKDGRCTGGQHWEWDGVRFEVLHPANDADTSVLRPNTVSCVIRVQGTGASALLTGDIERDQEIRLLRERRESLASDVLLVPHHGSRTSSSPAFLEAVDPRVAVFQAGHLNRYGHPAADVLARYRERAIVTVDSPNCGAWTWYSASRNDNPMAGCQRVLARRYWHWRASEAP